MLYDKKPSIEDLQSMIKQEGQYLKEVQTVDIKKQKATIVENEAFLNKSDVDRLLEDPSEISRVAAGFLENGYTIQNEFEVNGEKYKLNTNEIIDILFDKGFTGVSLEHSHGTIRASGLTNKIGEDFIRSEELEDPSYTISQNYEVKISNNFASFENYDSATINIDFHHPDNVMPENIKAALEELSSRTDLELSGVRLNFDFGNGNTLELGRGSPLSLLAEGIDQAEIFISTEFYEHCSFVIEYDNNEASASCVPVSESPYITEKSETQEQTDAPQIDNKYETVNNGSSGIKM